MVTYAYLQRLYRELRAMSSYQRTANAKDAYQKLEDLLQGQMGIGPGYFTATRIGCALLAADGQLTMAEYEMFRVFAESSCTYDELYDTVASVSKDFRGALSHLTTRGEEVRMVGGYLAAAIFAEKGYFGDNEETIFRILAQD